MIGFNKNTKINTINIRNVSTNDNLYTHTFSIDNNKMEFYYQGEINYDNKIPIWEGYGKMWTDYFSYCGNFKSGKPNGYGIYKYTGNLNIIDIPNEFVKLYKGEFKDGYKHGYGIEIYKNNESFEGNFVNSLRDGEGIYYNSNGSEKVKGLWDQGSIINTSQITEFWDNGNIKYKGGFNINYWNGKGILYYPSGNICYHGTFFKNNLEFGIISSKNNVMLVSGDFSSPKGNKIFYYENGERYIEYNNLELKHFSNNGIILSKGTIYNFDLLDINTNNLLKSEYSIDYASYIPFKKCKIYYLDASINSPKLHKIVEYDESNNLTGDYKEFYKNGIIKKKAFYKKGIENGIYKEFFENGCIQIEGNMLNGRLMGKYNEYNLNNVLIKTGTYILSDNNNYILSDAKIFNINKKIIYEGKLNKNNKYFGNGKIYYENENNSIKYNGTLYNSKYNGQGNLYYENGNVAYQGDWHNGKRHGQGTSFYESTGTVEYLGSWVNEEKHGHGVLFSESGEQVYSGEFNYNGI